MKKHILLIIFVCLAVQLYAQKKNYNIGILLDNSTEEVLPLLSQLKTQIIAVVGEDATITFPEQSMLVNNYDLQKAKQHYNTLLTNDTDIILAFGVVNNVIVSQQKSHQKPTILFGAVNSDLVNVDLKKATSGVQNYTYIIESESYKEDLIKFKELTNFKNVGIVVEEEFVDILPLKETFDAELKELNANYKLIPFKNIDDITSNLNDIDAVYLAGGFFLKDEEIRQLGTTFINKKLPSFTISGIRDVQNGIMATNQSDNNFDQFMRRIALNIEAYVNGANLAELPVFIEYTPRLTVNYNTAETIGVPIKYSLISNTDFVGDFVNVLSEKKYTVLTVIDAVLADNLSLQSSKKNIALAEQDVKTAKSNYLPTLTASGTGTYVDPDAAEASLGQNPEFSTSGNITLSQTLFSEAAGANITIQEKLQKAQEESFNTDQLDAIFNGSNVYFTTLILKANAQIRMRNLDLTKRNLQIAEQNFNAGQSGKSDVLRFRSEMAQNTQAMVEAINQLEQGFISLNQIVNNPVGTEIDVEDVELDRGIFDKYNYEEITKLLDDPSLREPFIEFLIQEAQNNAPELKALGYNIEATERSLRLYDSGRFMPTVALQGQYNRTFSRSGAGSTSATGMPLLDDNYNVALNISLPIFNQNSNNINKQTAIIQKDQLQINKDNTALAIAANVRNSVLNLINEVSNIELSKVSEATAKESLELTQTSYANGAVNIVQLLDAQSNYLNAQLSRNNATYNYLINALQLERYLGRYFLLNSEDDNAKFKQRFLEYLNTKN